ncbi:MAG: copper resistance protein NlpE N-terminal domain-containing protein [Bacteroidota bacterium]|nr:copper resistance protein NlpE N-terminal domain-containing protein [Bacteroidota bacterium]
MKNQLIIIAAVFVLFVACKTEKETEKIKSATANEVSMADIAGTYHGVLPCASCAGIDTEIQLSKDGLYQIYQAYIDEDKEFATHGTYEYNQKYNVIQLLGENEDPKYHQYAFKNDRIVKLNERGKPIKGELAEMYELRKVANMELLLDRYWKLTMINGKSIDAKHLPQKEAYLVFNDDQRISGNTGCNSLSADYKLPVDGKIEISKIITTKMACAKIDYEADLILALKAATSYRITDSVLLIFNEEQNQRLKYVEAEKPSGF